MSPGWQLWSSLETLKTSFKVHREYQGSHADDLSVSVINHYLTEDCWLCVMLSQWSTCILYTWHIHCKVVMLTTFSSLSTTEVVEMITFGVQPMSKMPSTRHFRFSVCYYFIGVCGYSRDKQPLGVINHYKCYFCAYMFCIYISFKHCHQ